MKPRPCARCGHVRRRHTTRYRLGAIEPTSLAVPCVAYVRPIGRVLAAFFLLVFGGAR